MKRSLWTFAVALVILAARPAGAQGSFGIFGTGSKAADAADWTLGGGVAIRSRFLVFLGAELTAGYRYDNYKVNGTQVLKVEQIPVQLSVLVYLPLGPVRPYALGGGGYYYTRSTAGGSITLTDLKEGKFGGHAGAGLEIQMGGKMFLHADARYVFMNLTSVDDINAIYKGDLKANFMTAGVGLNFQF